MSAEVRAHTLELTVKVAEWVPTHAARDEASPEFRHNRERLLADGHTNCWGCAIAGRTMPATQCHHVGMEWCEADAADWDKVLAFLEVLDPYGYAAKMKGQPLTGPDDLRNLLMLCTDCHIGSPRQPADTTDEPGPTDYLTEGGIHYAPLPVWLAARLRKGATAGAP